ncbi:GNAT family N-acetyltransferase [Adhaeribacter rhizoryzae]|uniref:N-acetyltransferase n=1 Tax=Adhaeribacter rhizoryzae TaxID=2607907 RepID=A0A5M6DG34_9BACT|nr:GNAT family N-acetyltransferase [Adhaeribacter rhizoryzae]KAA5546527.1 N-acetyltransferase [Adhaeribacter rhizoryzae]
MDINIQHDKEAQEFTAQLEGDQAELAYALPEDDVIDFQHTFVPEDYRNEGVANQLIEAGLNYAKEQKFKVIASCPAVSTYVRRHKEYQPLLKNFL